MDFGLGAPIVEIGGKTRRTWLFRAVLSHSRKGYSEVVLRQDTETFLRVLENAVKTRFGTLDTPIPVARVKKSAAAIRIMSVSP